MSEKQRPDPSGTLNRRDLLKAAMVAPTAALAQLTPARAAGSPANAAAEAEYAPKIFNPHQWKTLRVLSDLILPADERSGSATAAGVPEFIDDWLNIHEDQMKTAVLGSLTWIDMESSRQFSHDFTDCSETQQKQILDRIAYPTKAAPDDSGVVAAFGHIRDLVLGGFYSSKIGIADLRYQGNQMVESWDGCPESATARLGVDYSNWEHWKS
jgi:hypothetical protein